MDEKITREEYTLDCSQSKVFLVNEQKQRYRQNGRQHSAYSKLSEHLDEVKSLRRISFSRAKYVEVIFIMICAI